MTDRRIGTTKVDIFKCRTATIPEFYLVDTPGFDDTNKSDTEILMDVAAWLKRAYEAQILLTGIIYLHRINDVRLGGAGMKNLRMFKKLCGNNVLPRVVLATTFWSMVSEAQGKQREDELKSKPNFWGDMIKSRSRVFRQDRRKRSAEEIVEYLVSTKEEAIPLAIQQQMVDEGLKLDETGAGIELDSQLLAQKKMYEEQLASMREEMKVAMAAHDQELHDQLKEQREEIEQKLKKEELDRRKLEATNEELMRRLDDTLKKDYGEEAHKLEILMKGHEFELQSMRDQKAAWEEKRELQQQVDREKQKLEMLRWKLAQYGRCSVM